MQGIFLKFYVNEHSEHRGILLFEWLLERAKKKRHSWWHGNARHSRIRTARKVA